MKRAPLKFTTQRIADEYGTIDLDTAPDGRVRRTTWDHDGNLLDKSGWLEPGGSLWFNAVQGFAYTPPSALARRSRS